MKAVVNVTKIDWDTETDTNDADDIAAAAALPTGPLSITVDIDDKDEDTVLEAVLDHLSDTYGFLVLDVQYETIGYTSDVDESSHY